jgi:hypothetical protein
VWLHREIAERGRGRVWWARAGIEYVLEGEKGRLPQFLHGTTSQKMAFFILAMVYCTIIAGMSKCVY